MWSASITADSRWLTMTTIRPGAARAGRPGCATRCRCPLPTGHRQQQQRRIRQQRLAMGHRLALATRKRHPRSPPGDQPLGSRLMSSWIAAIRATRSICSGLASGRPARCSPATVADSRNGSCGAGDGLTQRSQAVMRQRLPAPGDAPWLPTYWRSSSLSSVLCWPRWARRCRAMLPGSRRSDTCCSAPWALARPGRDSEAHPCHSRSRLRWGGHPRRRHRPRPAAAPAPVPIGPVAARPRFRTG